MSLNDDEIPVLTEDGRQAAGDGGDDVDVDADNSDEDGDATAAPAHATDEAVTDLSNRCVSCLDMNKFPCLLRIVSYRIVSHRIQRPLFVLSVPHMPCAIYSSLSIETCRLLFYFHLFLYC
jgi:hypothetical protein